MDERDGPLQQKFRFLLIHIGSELQSKNCKAIRFAHRINSFKKEDDEEGLDILSELMQKGVFDAYHPDGLKKILEVIDRKDLSNEVRKYHNSPLFKKEMKRKLVQRTREHFLHSDSREDEQTQQSEGKLLSVVERLLSHTSAMMEQTLALISSVETLVSNETSRPQVLESITATKAKMEDISVAIKVLAREVEQTDNRSPDDSQPTMDHLSVKSGETSTGKGLRYRSHSDITIPPTKFLSMNSPTLRLARKGQKAMMTLWSEFCPTKHRQKSVGSDSECSNRSRTGSASSYEDEERYVSNATGIIKRDGPQPTNEDSSQSDTLSNKSDRIYDDPDSPDPPPRVRMYMNIPILSVEDTECSIIDDNRRTCPVTYDDLDTPDGYETVSFGQLTEQR